MVLLEIWTRSFLLLQKQSRLSLLTSNSVYNWKWTFWTAGFYTRQFVCKWAKHRYYACMNICAYMNICIWRIGDIEPTGEMGHERTWECSFTHKREYIAVRWKRWGMKEHENVLSRTKENVLLCGGRDGAWKRMYYYRFPCWNNKNNAVW